MKKILFLMLSTCSFIGSLQAAAHAEQDLPLIQRQERAAQLAQHDRDLRERRAAARRALQAERAQALQPIQEGEEAQQETGIHRRLFN